MRGWDSGIRVRTSEGCVIQNGEPLIVALPASLQSHPQSALAKDLAPPGPVSLSLHYRQSVPGMGP